MAKLKARAAGINCISMQVRVQQHNSMGCFHSRGQSAWLINSIFGQIFHLPVIALEMFFRFNIFKGQPWRSIVQFNL
jgi:hypothetical protein